MATSVQHHPRITMISAIFIVTLTDQVDINLETSAPLLELDGIAIEFDL
jgi:hypothetical protein